MCCVHGMLPGARLQRQTLRPACWECSDSSDTACNAYIYMPAMVVGEVAHVVVMILAGIGTMTWGGTLGSSRVLHLVEVRWAGPTPHSQVSICMAYMALM